MGDTSEEAYQDPVKILFATPELSPFNQTGGLGDVAASLTRALRKLDEDVRLLLPGYPAIKAATRESRPILGLVDAVGREGCILFTRLAGTEVPAYVVDFPFYFAALETPYASTSEDPAAEAARFYRFAAVAVQLAMGEDPDWRPDVIHCNDWATGLIPALLKGYADRPAALFTVHNLAYQGLFPATTHTDLGLAEDLWSMQALEYHGQLSFMKGGLVFADVISTVSPTYAQEILTPELGFGLDGLLRSRRDQLYGVLNGVDYDLWNPLLDQFIPAKFGPQNMAGKAVCKEALQQRFGLPIRPRTPLLGVVSRLTEQKGIDLVVQSLEQLLATDVQLVLLGSGDPDLEGRLLSAQAHNAQQMGIHLGYDDVLAHQIIAGSDIFLMPSRFEPCGLTQLYSMRYGTIPIVHETGGLADTVVGVPEPEASGFSYSPNTAHGLLDAVFQAIKLYARGPHQKWQSMQKVAMSRDFSWQRSAAQYGRLYRLAVSEAGRADAQLRVDTESAPP